MKKSEVITLYRSELVEEMARCYRSVLECGGRIQYNLYIWDDGEIERLEGVNGDIMSLIPKDSETRSLYYVCTISAPCFDPWDYADHSAPEDENERESERQEIIDFLVDEYMPNSADEILSFTIAAAKADESLQKAYDEFIKG